MCITWLVELALVTFKKLNNISSVVVTFSYCAQV